MSRSKHAEHGGKLPREQGEEDGKGRGLGSGGDADWEAGGHRRLVPEKAVLLMGSLRNQSLP